MGKKGKTVFVGIGGVVAAMAIFVWFRGWPFGGYPIVCFHIERDSYGYQVTIAHEIDPLSVHEIGVADAANREWVCRLEAKPEVYPATPITWRYGDPHKMFTMVTPCEPLTANREYVIASRGSTRGFTIDSDREVHLGPQNCTVVE